MCTIFYIPFSDLEQFTAYPSGAMLEMSNGYPHSTSPMGGSPSPGPSPGIGAHHMNKCKSVTNILIFLICFAWINMSFSF